MLVRPEGPQVNRPGRKAGMNEGGTMSAESAARSIMRILQTRVFALPYVSHLRRSLFEQSYPGLTAGPIHLRPFGPHYL